MIKIMFLMCSERKNTLIVSFLSENTPIFELVKF